MDFAQVMNEWIGLKTQLAAARKDLAVLNKREKELKAFVTTHMAQNDIDTVKVKDKVKVNLNTKDVIRVGLMTYFEQDAARTDGALLAIIAAQPVKEVSSVSVSGLKA
jgi:endo-1,4-beta-mannosidase